MRTFRIPFRITTGFLWRLGMILAGAGVVAWMLLAMLNRNRQLGGEWILIGAAAISTLTAVLLAVRELRCWVRPAWKLRNLLEGARAGEVPIEEFATVTGGLAGIAGLIQHLLRDLKDQKRQLNQLNDEIRQRVEGRTEALQREIGSLRVQATRDKLTGLHNRRMLEAALPRLIARARTNGADLSVVAVDVDNFKILNDTLGHSAGDDFLKSLAQLMRSTLRAHDLAFRCGGDEFLLVLPETSPEQAHVISQRLIQLVESLARPMHLDHPPGVSIGIAALSAGFVEQTDLLHQADEDLYAFKRRQKARRKSA